MQCRGTNVMRASCYPRILTLFRAEAGVRVYQPIGCYPGAETLAKTVTSLLIIPSVLGVRSKFSLLENVIVYGLSL